MTLCGMENLEQCLAYNHGFREQDFGSVLSDSAYCEWFLGQLTK
jgi:hypothetical protein